jgi:acyl carrier protein
MGLDVAELIIEVEESFRIRLDDNELPEIKTVGQLQATVLAKLGKKATSVCLSSAAFYRLRRVLTGTYGVAREQIRLATPMEGIIPADERRIQWRSLGQLLGEWRLPELERPLWLRRTLLWPALTTAVLGALIGLLAHGTTSYLGWGFALSALLLLIPAYRLTVPLAVCIPGECETVRDTVRTFLRMNHGAMAVSVGQVNEVEVWQSLCSIIGLNLGVDAKSLTPETRFVEDLGAG